MRGRGLTPLPLTWASHDSLRLVRLTGQVPEARGNGAVLGSGLGWQRTGGLAICRAGTQKQVG